MSLDGTEHTYTGTPRAAGSGPAHGPTRWFVNREPVRPCPHIMLTAMQERELTMVKSGRCNGESEAKLYISNLDYDVSSKDIKLLFSDVGELRSQSVHYDKSGRSKGTAEVVFARQIDALAAMKKYNNLPLDGKPMIIELVGADSFTSTT
ncbi:THO complex subunit 4A isoform X1 [Ricinus communis]|uniref:RNA and export factor binding protein, putative n=1 Tax=Ricinus communis TaxID=3988 RepID=B9SR27_RICCO|nr:THO complex subunit 4A isoform X1 [Ricinus communis]XP_015580410.1 THO complex subunit 4A isoform X1 [Ricinus communis]EEF33929.1 RNA and export factor binding protein, putative [Ricinus communis]|eukprot:XP_002528446.1 THO complex subunit 4A [Ricinus communis]